MKKVILFASVSFASGILFVNIYNSIVNATAFESNIPDSIISARELFKTINPGDYFKIFAPLTHLLSLLSLILFWKRSKQIRLFLAIAFLCYLVADIFSFIYFHPRNDIMFLSKEVPNNETLKQVASEWSSMNWLRSMIVFLGVISSFLAVHKIYTFQVKFGPTCP